MAMRKSRAIVRVILPSHTPTQEFLAGLTMDLGLEVRLVHGRITERETRLELELSGDPSSVLEGKSRCARKNRPVCMRAS